MGWGYSWEQHQQPLRYLLRKAYLIFQVKELWKEQRCWFWLWCNKFEQLVREVVEEEGIVQQQKRLQTSLRLYMVMTTPALVIDDKWYQWTLPNKDKL